MTRPSIPGPSRPEPDGAGNGSAAGNGAPRQTAAPARGLGPGPGPARWMAGGMSTEKALDFRRSSLRLLGLLRPERALIGAVLGFGLASVTLSVIGPKILGRATDIVF